MRKSKLKRAKWLGTAAAAIIWCAGHAQGATFITGVTESGTGLDPFPVTFSGESYNHANLGAITIPTLDEDRISFTDRTHQYNGGVGLPTIAQLGLTGAEYILSANDNREVGNYRLDITLAQTVDMFVFMDTRVPAPAWLPNNGFVNTYQRLGIDESGDGVGPGNGINQTFDIWKKTNVGPGVVSTFERGGTGNNQYGVAVTAPGGGPAIQLPAAAAPNFALIDLGATGGRPETGAVADLSANKQIGAAAHNTNNTNLAARTLVSNTGHQFTVAVDNLNAANVAVGAIDWRDRGDGYAGTAPFDEPLVRLGEDFFKNNAGILRVTLDGLPAGLYEVTSFHKDPDNSQSEAIQISVDAGEGLGYLPTGVVGNASEPGGANVPGVNGITTLFMMSRSATFSFVADGVNPVRILFDGSAAVDKEVPLNGLSLTLIPEPTTLMFVGLSLTGLIRRRPHA